MSGLDTTGIHNKRVHTCAYITDVYITDRQNLPDEKPHPASLDVEILALYDLEQVDQLIK